MRIDRPGTPIRPISLSQPSRCWPRQSADAGRAINVAGDKPLTQIEVVNEFAKTVGRQAAIVRVPREIIARNGGNGLAEPLYFGEYYDLPPITEAVGRVRRVLNVTMTPFATGLKETYKWYLRHGEQRTLDFSFEDRVIRQAKETSRPAHGM
jgi:hypothetical protein